MSQPICHDGTDDHAPTAGDFPVPGMLDIDPNSPHGSALIAATAAAHGPLLAPAAHRLSRLFLLRSPWAPGLRFAGGQVQYDGGPDALCDPRVFSQSGPSETLEGGLAACIGEAIELLSQIERPGDVAGTARPGDVQHTLMPGTQPVIARHLAAAGRLADIPLDWMRGHLLDSGHEVRIPADWCVRRSPARNTLPPPWILGSGVAAGPDWDWAASRALLELAERDAAALWWIGGRRGRPVALHDPAMTEACRLASHLRQDQTARACWLLDITSVPGIPCVVAVSTDPDGRGSAFGFGARLTLADAARGALLENAQMELALLLARAKSLNAHHGAALTATDQKHLDQAAGIDAAGCDLLHPSGTARSHAAFAGGDALASVTAAFTAAGIGAALVDLTRPEFGLPVVRAIAPLLQPIPSTVVSLRLQSALTETGGGARFTRGVPLF
jgi:ribosomal protein S12 methylthiotransferase accessory factor